MHDRYSRQELFTPIGKEGQKQLLNRHVLLIGAGALGTPTAEMLVRAGVGTLSIIDRDYVEYSNLQRQQMYTEQHAMEQYPKAIAASEQLRKINSEINVNPIVGDADPQWLDDFLQRERPHVIIDATDNFETRLIINDISLKWKVPWIYGACVGATGITFTIIPGTTPCLHCLLDTLPSNTLTCDTAGIIGPAAQMVTSYQTTEALKLLLDDMDSLRSELVYFDLWKNHYTTMKINSLRKKDCPSCGEMRTYPYLNTDNQTRFAVLCGRETIQIRPPAQVKRNLVTIANQLPSYAENIKSNEFLVSFSIGNQSFVMFKDGRLFIHGLKDLQKAKKLYYQLFS